MTVPIPKATWDAARWSGCIDDFNEWRGACLDSFTRVEHAVTETLILLCPVAGTDGGPMLPHLTGGRVEALAKALRREDPGGRAVAALEAFAPHQELRTILCHGVAKVVIDRYGRWSVLITVLELRGGRPIRRLVEFTQRDLLDRLVALRRDAQALGSLLGQIRQRRTATKMPAAASTIP